MNILPFIIVSLVILSYSSFSFFRERQATFWEERSYSGYMSAERKLRNKIVSAHYAKIRFGDKEKKDKDTKEKKSPPKDDASYVNQRDKHQLSELSKLNIAPLLRGQSKELYTIAAHLLLELYKEADFFKNARIPDLHIAILNSFIEKGQENKKAVHMKDFFPDSLKLRPIFYKMAKGTHLGYPALEEFFTIDHNVERKPISFSFASIPLLEVLFGKEAAKKILEKEHEKWLEDETSHRLSKDELVEILNHSSRKPFDYHKIENLIDFSRTAAPKKHLISLDKTTQILITKEL